MYDPYQFYVIIENIIVSKVVIKILNLHSLRILFYLHKKTRFTFMQYSLILSFYLKSNMKESYQLRHVGLFWENSSAMQRLALLTNKIQREPTNTHNILIDTQYFAGLLKWCKATVNIFVLYYFICTKLN